MSKKSIKIKQNNSDNKNVNKKKKHTKNLSMQNGKTISITRTSDVLSQSLLKGAWVWISYCKRVL